MNTNKLKVAMAEAGYSQRKLAASMQMTVNTINAKINGKNPITLDEATLIGKNLNLSKEKFDEIFLDKVN